MSRQVRQVGLSRIVLWIGLVVVKHIYNTLSQHPFFCWVFFTVVLVLRKPGTVMHAQFWAEDGPVWYEDAYAHEWASLFIPHTGYFQTIPRLVALAGQSVPLAYAPLLFSLVAVSVQAMPSVLLVSPRMANAWHHSASRLAFAVMLLVLPNVSETFGNLTNSQWYLAVLSFLLLLISPSRNILMCVVDLIVITIGGLSGPFCLFLLPVAFWQALEVKIGLAWLRFGILSVCSIIQLNSLALTMHAMRCTAPLGASVTTLARIVASQVEIGGLIGAHFLSVLAHPIQRIEAR